MNFEFCDQPRKVIARALREFETTALA